MMFMYAAKFNQLTLADLSGHAPLRGPRPPPPREILDPPLINAHHILPDCGDGLVSTLLIVSALLTTVVKPRTQS